MACSCEIVTRPKLHINFQENGFRRNAAVGILPHFVISHFPLYVFLLQAETLRGFTFSEPCIVQYIYEKDQQDADFISFICFNYTILYIIRTNKFITRKLFLYKQHIVFSMHVYYI
jgi:hypothetical protein